MSKNENKCIYIFKKGINIGTKCDIIKCKLHKNNNGLIEKTIIKKLQNENMIVEKILDLNTSVDNKAIIMKSYNSIKKLDDNSTEYYKNKIFIDKSLLIPWDKFYNIRDFINIRDTFNIKDKILIKNFVQKIKNELDNEIFGMDNVKNEILNYICKFISNPLSQNNNIALYGSAGVCKTRFVKILSRILGLKMKVISLGGMKDSSYLLGHHFTYQESQCGIISQSVIDSQIMNPILYFDELDKVSSKDIYSILTNITDPTVNNDFKDHYFNNLSIDLSRVFYIFTFNDISKVNKILLDRLNVIYIENPSKKNKIVILKLHCLNEIISNIGMNINVIFSDLCYNKIIEYTDKNIDSTISSGIRECVRILEKILLEINKELLTNNIHNEKIVQLNIIDSRFDYYFNKLKPQFMFILNSDFPYNMYI